MDSGPDRFLCYSDDDLEGRCGKWKNGRFLCQPSLRMKRESGTQGGYLPFLDGLRGIAILAVFLFHVLGPSFGFDQLPWKGQTRDLGYDHIFLAVYPLSFGGLGVAIFFAISGYCIHLSHVNGRSSGWVPFFFRRFFRIYPAYLAAIGLFLFVLPWMGAVPGVHFLKQMTANVLAVQNFWEHLRFGINPSFWSIAVEIQLYLLYPLLLLLVRRMGWARVLLLVVGGEVGIRLLPSTLSWLELPQLPFFIRASPLAYWGSWAFGACLADHHLRGARSVFARMSPSLLMMGVIFVSFFKAMSGLTFPLCALATTAAMERFHSGRWSIPNAGWRMRVWGHLSMLGVVSYSFYLFHQPFLIWIGGSMRDRLPALGTLCCLLLLYPLLLIVAKLGHSFLEQPSIALGKKVVKGWLNRK